MSRQLLHFIIHLRLHYQFLILSGGYLLAALFMKDVNWQQFWLQFLNVHVLLFGGATAFNSWWDKDEGPIGGLKHPPKMEPWMCQASLLLQCAGLIWAFNVGWEFTLIYSVSIMFFWLYSTPHLRWKGKPILSLVAIGISTGTNAYLMGLLAAGLNAISGFYFLISIGVAFIVLSLYPASQIYQTEEDSRRGDQTFAIQYGLKGVKWLFTVFFVAGAIILSWGLMQVQFRIGVIFGILSFMVFLIIGFLVWRLQHREGEYNIVMRIKFLVSFSFVLFILSALLSSR